MRDLTDENASWGYDFIDFCDYIGWELDEWQQWLAIHLGELYEDGSPRYRKAIVLVARQNGKTIFTRLLILYWMWVDRVKLILGTSTDRAMAHKSWTAVIAMAEQSILNDDLPAKHTYAQTNEEDFWNDYNSHYQFSAPNRRAGRGDTVERAVLDELREHHTRDVWDAVIPAMSAVPDALAVCITNEGDMKSIVLHEEFDAAHDDIIRGETDDTDTFLAAWCSPPGSDATDLEALAYANPSLNRPRKNGKWVRGDGLLRTAKKAKRIGGEALAGFRTEYMCERVDLLEPAINPDQWKLAGLSDAELVDLAAERNKLALCFDISLDGTHISLVGAAKIDGKIHVELLKTWRGFGCTQHFRSEFPAIAAQIKPAVIGWFPQGPSAAVAAEFKERKGNSLWPPRGVKVEEIGAADTPAVCMGLNEVVIAGDLGHPRDPVLDKHVASTQKMHRGESLWVFTRKGELPIDGTYALAGAVHLARTLKPRVALVAVTARGR